MMLSRGTIAETKTVNGVQFVRVDLGDKEITGWMERLQVLGLTGKPSKGAQSVVGFIGGSREHPVCFALDDGRSRPAGLADDDICLYNVASPSTKIVLKANGEIHYYGTKHVLHGDMECTGDISATGDISTTLGQVRAGLVGLSSHTHGPGNTPTTTGPAVG